MLSPVQTWLLEGGVCSHRPLPAQVPEAVAPCQASSVASVASRALPGVRHSAVCKCLDVRASGARILREGRPAKFKVLFFLITSTAGIIQRQPEALAFMRPSTSPATEQILKVPGENGSANR